MTRVPTGIEGLDELLRGGFPENTVNLVSGPAGSAKSLLGLQFVYNGAQAFNETGVYITLEESRENIERALKNYNMDYNRFLHVKCRSVFCPSTIFGIWRKYW